MEQFPSLCRCLWVLVLSLALTGLAVAQSEAAPAVNGQKPASENASAPQIDPGNAGRLLIGPGDEAEFSVYGVPDLTQHVRVGATGEISLPLIGNLTVAGLTSDDAQALIEKKLQDGGFLNNPHVIFLVKSYTTQNVTILGEVAKPGTYPALMARHLYDLFTAAGGLTQRAGNEVTIGHRGDSGKPDVIKLSGDPVVSSNNNVDLHPGDTVVVARAGIVYVLGEVGKPGGFVMENEQQVSAMQVIAMAGGPTRLAAMGKTTLIRKTAQGLENRKLDLKKIFEAKAQDIPLQADDILFVPPSRGKAAVEKGTNSILGMIGSLALYRF